MDSEAQESNLDSKMEDKLLYEGLRIVEVDSLDTFYSKGRIPLSTLSGKFNQNENLVLKTGNRSGGGLAIVKGSQAVRVYEKSTYGVEPKNKEQIFALNMLSDPSIQAVTLTGPAGTGKSLLTIASALDQTFGKTARYKKLIYIKSLQPVGRDIGYLPGDLSDKADPFYGALRDCLTLCRKRKQLDDLVGWEDNAKIQKMPSNFVRGRTFRKSFVIVDEAQNFSTHELKTILTRLDGDSKVVVLGDFEQSDVKLKDAEKGLFKVVEAFKDEKKFGHINLVKSERSELAELVSKKLK